MNVLKLFIVSILLFDCLGISAQNIKKLQYFFNSDPGFDSMTIVTFNPVLSNLNGYTYSPSISSLTNGLNILFVRIQDENYQWSQTTQKVFFKEASISNPITNVVATEYYFNTDPGFGLATNAPITAGLNPIFDITASIASLPVGLNTMYVRSKDDNGKWSLTTANILYKEPSISNPITNVVATEYYFNTDPGFGLATNAPMTAGLNPIFDITASIASLPVGLNTMYVRSKDANGKWSLTTANILYKEPSISNPITNVVATEYYFNTDPGFGLATNASMTAGLNPIFDITASIASLPVGLNTMYVRSKDANGKWSLTTANILYKEASTSNPIPNVVATEYYFNTDPGFGLATNAPMTADLNPIFDITASIASLSNGLNTLYVRSRDANGKWSLTTANILYKEPSISNPIPNVVATEYYFNTDPGFGLATNATITAGLNPIFDITASIASLSNGLNTLYVRSKDTNGNWSLTTANILYKEPSISNPIPNVVATEYYFNTDPGFGLATNAPISAGINPIFDITPTITSLPYGLNRFYVRSKDVNGNWSLSNVHLFYRESIVDAPIFNLTKAEYYFNTDPGFGMGTNAALTNGKDIVFDISASIASLQNGLNRLYVRVKDESGSWSVTSEKLFFKEPAVNNLIPTIVGAEFYFNTDPGTNFGFPATVTPNQNIVFDFTSSIASLNNGLNRLGIRTKDEYGKWSVTAMYLFYKEPIVPNLPLGEFTRLEWYWAIDPGFGNGTAVAIPSPNNGILTNLNFVVPVSVSFSGTKQNLFIRALDDWSLTTVKVVDFTSIALPVTLLEFSAQKNKTNVNLRWVTAKEINVSHYEVEHSIEGSSYVNIGSVDATANPSNEKTYKLVHENPSLGFNYYRLKTIDFDEAFTYSAPIKILFSDEKNKFEIYPNPALDFIQVRIPTYVDATNSLVAEVLDSKGSLVLKNGITDKINVSKLLGGSYSIIIKEAKGNVLFIGKFVKI